MRRFLIPVLMSALLVTSGCGDSRLERAGSGAAIGAGTGLVIGGLCCGDPGDHGVRGFYVGAGVGALIGLLLNHPLFFDTRD